MSKEKLDFEKDVSIDKLRLDEEWLTHGNRMIRVTRLKAEAKRIWDRAVEKKKTIRSELILQAKGKDGDKLLKVEKITDSVIEAWYRTQQKYIDAKEAEIEAEFDYNELDGAVLAFTHRKNGLQDLVQLHITGYWSDPKEPKGSHIKDKAVNSAAERQRNVLKDKYNKRRSNDE